MAQTKPISQQVRFTQDGTGAVERTVDDKLKETISVTDFGAVGDGSDNTAIIQTAINAFDGPSSEVRLIIPDNVKFSLASLTHVGNLSLEYTFGDDTSNPNTAVGASGQRVTYSDRGVSGIADNDVMVGEAPYHPAIILNTRPDIIANSPWVTPSQQANPNISFIYRSEGFNRFQTVWRETDVAEGGWDCTFWRTLYTSSGITIASFSTPPSVGDFVTTSSGATCVVNAINGSGITLQQHIGEPQNGDTITDSNETTTDTLTSIAKSASSFINRIGVSSGRNGNALVNMPPSRAARNLSVGGVVGIEAGNGSIYGTSDPELQIMDDLDSPTMGFRLRYNPTNNNIEIIKAGTSTVVFSIDQTTLTQTVPTGRATASYGAPIVYIDASISGISPRISSGSGSPEGVVAAGVGSMYLNKSGSTGSTLYVKESGAGTTGWVAK